MHLQYPFSLRQISGAIALAIGAGTSLGALAQTTLLRAPASTQPTGMHNGATNNQTSQLGGRTGPVVAAESGQPVSTLSMTNPTTVGTPPTSGDAAIGVAIGTQVLKGASVGKAQKLAAMSAMLLAASKTEPNQIKKANLEATAKAPDMDVGVSLTVANPKAALGYLTFYSATVNFNTGTTVIEPVNSKPEYGGVAAGVLCDFKRNGKTTGFYLVNFVVEIT